MDRVVSSVTSGDFAFHQLFLRLLFLIPTSAGNDTELALSVAVNAAAAAAVAYAIIIILRK